MKILAIIGLGVTFLLNAGSVHAGKIDSAKRDVPGLAITTFSDYMPFGYLNNKGSIDDQLSSIFKKTLSKFLRELGFKQKYQLFETTDDALEDMHIGKTNLFMGAYYSTHVFEDFEFIYPSILNNSIYLMMLPSRIREVHNTADLKNMKGIYSQKEYFSDYMINNFEKLKMKKVDNADEAYKALLTGEADFMLGSYYANYVMIVQKGLKNYIAFSSKPLWNMPMFLALSKMTANSKIVRQGLQKLLESEKFKNELSQDIKDFVEEIERNSVGTVPPTYINESKKNVLTPADEELKKLEENN